MNEAATDTVPVFSNGKGKVYLEIVPTKLGVRVQPSELGERSLNDFWVVWLRDLLLERRDTRGSIGVVLEKGCVNVSWSGSKESLIETIRRLGAQIRPLPQPPIRRVDQRLSDGMYPIRWEVQSSVGPDFPDAVASVSVPGHAKLLGWGAPGEHLFLRRYQRCKVPAWTIGLSIEKQLALALNP